MKLMLLSLFFGLAILGCHPKTTVTVYGDPSFGFSLKPEDFLGEPADFNGTWESDCTGLTADNGKFVAHCSFSLVQTQELTLNVTITFDQQTISVPFPTLRISGNDLIDETTARIRGRIGYKAVSLETPGNERFTAKFYNSKNIWYTFQVGEVYFFGITTNE